MNQTEFLASTCDLLISLEKSRAQGAIWFGFCFLFAEKLFVFFFKPITKGSNCNCVITFDSHLKTVTTRRAASDLIGRMKSNKRAVSVARI